MKRTHWPARWTGCLAALLSAALLLAGCGKAGPAASSSRPRTGTAAVSTAAAVYPTTAPSTSTSVWTTAASTRERTVTTASATAPPTTSSSAPSATAAPVLTAAAALLYDETGGTILFEREPEALRQPASLTKMLTGIVALEHCPADAVLPVEQEVLDLVMYDASKARLEAGMELTLYELLQALLLPSGCDAGYVIAAGVGRRMAGDDSLPVQEAVDRFCSVMNDTAQRLGAEHSHFVNPDGYPHDEQLTTVRDLLLIARAARQVPLLRDIMAQPQAQVAAGGKTLTWRNSNAMLRQDSPYYMPDVTGMKTGYAQAAGHCLAVSASIGGRDYIAIVLGCPGNKEKYSDIRLLFDKISSK